MLVACCGSWCWLWIWVLLWVWLLAVKLGVSCRPVIFRQLLLAVGQSARLLVQCCLLPHIVRWPRVWMLGVGLDVGCGSGYWLWISILAVGPVTGYIGLAAVWGSGYWLWISMTAGDLGGCCRSGRWIALIRTVTTPHYYLHHHHLHR